MQKEQRYRSHNKDRLLIGILALFLYHISMNCTTYRAFRAGLSSCTLA